MGASTKRQAPARAADTTGGRLDLAHRCFGWTLLCVALLFGTAVEALLGLKSVELLRDPVRRELWSLAHFHGVGLALLNLVYALWADGPGLSPSRRRAASRALLVGSTLLPIGFLLGGAFHPEGDPGLGIFLVPAGAALVIFVAAVHALAAWRA
jgi:hypothetical protein